MTAHASKNLPNLNETQTIELIKEYTPKLLSLYERADDLARDIPRMTHGMKPNTDQIGRGIELLDLWKTMRPAATRLAQYVSQTIEHGRLDQATDLELRLRLPEYEHHLRFLDEKARTLSKVLQNVQGSLPERAQEIQRVLIFP